MALPAGQIVRFGAVGAIGFCVDLGVYLMAAGIGLAPALAKPLATLVAIGATFGLNRSFTFVEAGRVPAGPAFLRYLGSSLAGAAVNWGVFMLALSAGSGALAAVVLASAVAMSFNYLAYKYFAFRLFLTK